MQKRNRLHVRVASYIFLIVINLTGANLGAEENNSPMSDPNTFELTGMLWGAKEIGAIDCRATGDRLPKSMDGWFKAVTEYSQSEKTRDLKLNSDIAALKKKIDEIMAQTTNKNLQIEALQMQIDSVNLSIESINGANGRIPLREKLLLVIQKSLEFTKNENQKIYSAYKNDLIHNGFDEAIKEAQRACDRKNIIERCESNGNEETCSTSEVENPVPGCETALKTIPTIHSGPAQAYGDIYLVKKIPSREINESMNKFEIEMTEMNNGIPKSNDSQFDWTTPVSNGLAKMIAARKEAGLICPNGEGKNNNKINEDISKKAKTFLEILGVPADDLSKSVKDFTAKWNEADLVIGQAAQRSVYFEKLKKLLEVLIKSDGVKLEKFQAELATLKINFKKVQKELGINEKVCPPSPLPNGVRICGGEYNVWCDPTTTEGKSWDAYISCMKGSEADAAKRPADSSVSDFVKNHPDFVGLVQNSEGQWVAKMKKPDGTIYYVDKSFDGVPVTAEKCGPSPAPPTFQCPGVTYNPWCDSKSEEGKRLAVWNSCNSLVQSTNAIECIPERRGSIIIKACPEAGSVSPGSDSSGGSSGGKSSSGASDVKKDPCTPDYPGGPVIGPCPATNNVGTSESEGGKNLSAEPSTSAGYAKAFSPAELEIYGGKVPNKTNFNFTQSKSAPSSISFSSKGKSIEVCSATKCRKDSDGPSLGRTFMGAPGENKAQDFIHRMSFTFKSDNYFKSNPKGHFSFGLRGELRNAKQDAKEAGADGRGVILGNIGGDERNAGHAKCGSGAVEIESFSRDSFAKGLSPRADEVFPETCSGSIFQDNKFYKVEVDVTRSKFILYRIYDGAGNLLQKNSIKDQPSTMIDPSLTGWFIRHVFDVTADFEDNDRDGVIDNESANWSLLIDNLKISSGAQKN